MKTFLTVLILTAALQSQVLKYVYDDMDQDTTVSLRQPIVVGSLHIDIFRVSTLDRSILYFNLGSFVSVDEENQISLMLSNDTVVTLTGSNDWNLSGVSYVRLSDEELSTISTFTIKKIRVRAYGGRYYDATLSQEQAYRLRKAAHLLRAELQSDIREVAHD